MCQACWLSRRFGEAVSSVRVPGRQCPPSGCPAGGGARWFPPASRSRRRSIKALGLAEGDAHVIRNAGGRAADALRSLVISQRLLGTTEVLVVHHTDCGMLTFDNPTLYGICQEQLGADASAIDFLPFRDVEQSVRDDVAHIRASPLIAKDTKVTGFVYDVKTGQLHEVA